MEKHASRSLNILWVAALTLAGLGFATAQNLSAGTVTINTSESGRMQVIDGFGTCMTAGSVKTTSKEDWFAKAYYDDLGASIMRMDITPHFKSPYSDHYYYSPWMSNDPTPAWNINNKANLGGPEGNRVRTYTGPEDYSREFGGLRAPIAVMGPDIHKNMALMDFDALEAQGRMAQAGLARKDKLGDFKLFASMWSPAPWLKRSSGASFPGENFSGSNNPKPPKGTPYPFVWFGNFAGGILDTSDKPLDVFNDGTGPTSALTQFARCTAATVKGFQDRYKVKYYAISIQNEVNFEEFYYSATYPTVTGYIAAIKAVRKEFDKYPDLKNILIIGPEDLLGSGKWEMWQIGGGSKPIVHKNLNYLTAIAADPEASKAVAFFCIHGYASDGGTAVGADSGHWNMWVNGWDESPNPAIPAHVKGFAGYGKKSWMTETSGESDAWLAPAKGFPGRGAWSIAFKTQQTLTAGRESACIYWQFAEKDTVTTTSCLSRKDGVTEQPKYVASKHFFKFIRPNAVALKTTVADDEGLTASSYLHEKNGTLTIVLVTRTDKATTAKIQIPETFRKVKELAAVTSSDGSLWKESKVVVKDGLAEVPVPGYGVVTLQAHK